MRVVLIGGESAGVRAFGALERSRHEVVAVFGRCGGWASLPTVAARHGVPAYLPSRLRDFALTSELHSRGVDVLLNVHSPVIVPPAMLSIARVGCFNLHPGPLPERAGRNPIPWAIAEGATTHGVTLHWMTPEPDRGPIAYQARFPIFPGDTGLTVSERCIERGVELVEQLLEDLPDVPSIPFDHTRWRSYPNEIPRGGVVCWSEGAARVVDLVRGCDFGPFAPPWGHPEAQIAGRTFELATASRTGRATTRPPGTLGAIGPEAVDVSAGDEWVRVERVHTPAGYQPAAPALFAASPREQLDHAA